MFNRVRTLEKSLNLRGVEPWLSIRQAEALTGVQMFPSC